MTPRQFRRKLGKRLTRKRARRAHHNNPQSREVPYKHQRQRLRDELAKKGDTP